MKRTLTMAIALCALLAASCAFAQGNLGRSPLSGLLGRHRANKQSVAQPPQEVYEKVPEEHRDSVRRAIERMALKTANAEASEKFDVIIGSSGAVLPWTNNCGKGVIIFDFPVERERRRPCGKFSADGRLVQTGPEDTFEEFKWRDKRRDELILAYWNNPAIVAEAVSDSEKSVAQERERNSLLKAAKEKIVKEREEREMESLRQSRLRDLDRETNRQLEERISLEEAMALAKKGEGKGFYQLALRYSLGDELPNDARAAHKMLVKACEANYANAILIEGMYDELHLGDETWGGLSDLWGKIRSAMYGYCGANHFDDTRNGCVKRNDSLTNEVAFARVMGKYERAKELGALAATNQIAALNKRLANFRKQEAEAKEKSDRENENDRRIKEMLGEKERLSDENQD